MYDDKEYHKKYYAEHYEQLKEYRKKYYQEHKKYFKEAFYKRWERKASLKCILCGGDLPDTKHSFKYCDKCVKDGKTSRQIRHLRNKRS